MEIQELENKWVSLNETTSAVFKSLRIDGLSVPDLFIGVSTEQNRCLILQLPKNYKPDFQSSVKQNLSLELYEKSRWIVLTLLDEQYHDLFNDLILSLYNKIKDILDPNIYVSELLRTYYKWSEFFVEGLGEGLSDNQIKGMLGELIVLKELLKKSSSLTLNDVLNSWKGPYDTGHDFVGEDKDIEVKTKILGASNIKISSEYQLQSEPGKALELNVVNVSNEPLNGISLGDMVLIIREYVIERLGDYTIVLRALAQKGLTLKTLNSYDNLKFQIVNMVVYECDNEDFPKLIRSELPDSINSVVYNLNINQIENFIISQTTF